MSETPMREEEKWLAEQDERMEKAAHVGQGRVINLTDSDSALPTPSPASEITPSDIESWIERRGYFGILCDGSATVILPDYDGEEGLSFTRKSLSEACALVERFCDEVPDADTVGADESSRRIGVWLAANDPSNAYCLAPARRQPAGEETPVAVWAVQDVDGDLRTIVGHMRSDAEHLAEQLSAHSSRSAPYTVVPLYRHPAAGATAGGATNG